MQNLNVIAAVALNGVIGDSKTNSIPWKISADLRRFKQLTTGKIVIMGANTFKSLPNGQALPNRRNVVITRQAFTVEDLSVEYPGIAPRGAYHSFPASIFCEVGEKWVIGGGKIYAEAMEWRPDNLYIIGTMNTADRSLAIVDYALRRRFAFVPLQPDYGDNFRSFLGERGLSAVMIEHICSAVSKLNSRIREDVNLGEGFQIGHSYFCNYSTKMDEGKWWNEVVSFELKPLLEEIWFDDSTKVAEALKQLSK